MDFTELLGDTRIVLGIFIGLLVLFILFLVLFIVMCDKNRRKADDIAQYKRILEEQQKTSEASRKKYLETVDQANLYANTNAELMDKNKNLEEALHATKGEVGALRLELDEANAKLAKKKKVKKTTKKVEKPKDYTAEELNKLTKHELLTLAKTRKLTGYYHINKDQLVDFILTEQNKGKTAK